MTDLSLVERAVESSPVIVIVLLAGCVVLWRTLREEVSSCRKLHADSIEANQRLAGAIEELSARIKDSR